MQKVQNCAARLVSKKRLSSTAITKFFMDHHWLEIKYRSVYKILLIVHNCIFNEAPVKIKELIKPGKSQRSLKLKETAFSNKYGKRAFSHAGPQLWNLLPLNLRKEENTSSFKKKLKSFLMTTGEKFLYSLTLK